MSNDPLVLAVLAAASIIGLVLDAVRRDRRG
jgi:hypothetical protein